jgi:hypothetical protein
MPITSSGGNRKERFYVQERIPCHRLLASKKRIAGRYGLKAKRFAKDFVLSSNNY